jgi:putative chitinase
MIIITADVLKAIAPGSKKTNYKHISGLSLWMNHWFSIFEIDTKAEICHYLAQCAHESDSFNTMEEYASGEAYEGRKDLRNIKSGDGVKYKGKGLIETTGRSNYIQLDTYIPKYFPDKKISFEKNPELLKEPQYAVWSACIFWDTRSLNDTANRPDTDKLTVKRLTHTLTPLEYITYRVNGGFNGLSERKAFYERAKTIL